MLEIRPCCECCNKDLPPDSPHARICSFECTFCANCADEILAGRCPNCGGNLVARPIRPPSALHQHPASTRRIYHLVRGHCCDALANPKSPIKTPGIDLDGCPAEAYAQ